MVAEKIYWNPFVEESTSFHHQQSLHGGIKKKERRGRGSRGVGEREGWVRREGEGGGGMVIRVREEVGERGKKGREKRGWKDWMSELT